VISSVLDMAGGAATMLAVIQKKSDQNFDELAKTLGKASTINLHVDFLQPGKGTHFIAKAWVLQSGNKITFTRMELFNHSDVLIAAGTGSYMVGN
jgi:acyl-coenzyme A thioesterase PaaI-like protein